MKLEVVLIFRINHKSKMICYSTKQHNSTRYKSLYCKSIFNRIDTFHCSASPDARKAVVCSTARAFYRIRLINFHGVEFVYRGCKRSAGQYISHPSPYFHCSFYKILLQDPLPITIFQTVSRRHAPSTAHHHLSCALSLISHFFPLFLSFPFYSC